MRRITGILMMIRAFTPLLFVLVVVWGIAQVAADFRAAVEVPIDNINVEIAALEETLITAQDYAETLGEEVQDIADVVSSISLPNILPNLPTSLSLPGFNIPDPRIRIPNSISIEWADFSYAVDELIPNDCGIFDFLCDAADWVVTTVIRVVTYPSDISVGTTSFRINIPNIPNISMPMPQVILDVRDGMNDMLDAVFSPITLLMETFSEVGALTTSLQAVPDHVSAVVSASTGLVSTMWDVVLRWSALLVIVVVLIGVVWFISIAATALDFLTRGWRRLFGSAP